MRTGEVEAVQQPRDGGLLHVQCPAHGEIVTEVMADGALRLRQALANIRVQVSSIWVLCS